MTARSGDAMSHVNFQAPQNIILVDLGASNSGRRRATIPPATAGEIRSSRNCMAAMRRHCGTNAADPLHLPFTCPNLFAPGDDCIRKY
jgi:hypothetical protein